MIMIHLLFFTLFQNIQSMPVLYNRKNKTLKNAWADIKMNNDT